MDMSLALRLNFLVREKHRVAPDLPRFDLTRLSCLYVFRPTPGCPATPPLLCPRTTRQGGYLDIDCRLLYL